MQPTEETFAYNGKLLPLWRVGGVSAVLLPPGKDGVARYMSRVFCKAHTPSRFYLRWNDDFGFPEWAHAVIAEDGTRAVHAVTDPTEQDGEDA